MVQNSNSFPYVSASRYEVNQSQECVSPKPVTFS